MFDHIMLDLLDRLPVMAPISFAAPVAMQGYRSRQRSYFHPRINRHTRRPHEHKREIARRLRRSA